MAKQISFKRLIHYWPLYLFVVPSALMVATFSYFPAASAIYHSTFRWNGDYINLFVGSANFRKALGEPVLWVVLLVLTMVMIFHSQKRTGMSQGLKIICGIGLPMVNLVAAWRLAPPESIEVVSVLKPLLIWGALNALAFWKVDRDNDNRLVYLTVLAAFGIAGVLKSLGLGTLIAWLASSLLTGLGLWVLPKRDMPKLKGLRILQGLVGAGMTVWTLALFAGGDTVLWKGFAVIAVLVLANILKMLPSIATAVVIHRLKSEASNYWYRVFFVIPMIIPGMVQLLIWKFFFESNGLLNLILRKTGIMHLLYLFDVKMQNGVFIKSDIAATMDFGAIMDAASNAAPAWLGSPELVLPAFILWGFPWVGVVGVLIYLAGLQSIDESVYEAADLDGVGAFGKFLHIELPLILTQVRINLVLLIISTLQMYGLILILYGDAGGPNGKMMVPGLHMFRNAFVEGYAGYACAIGLILFFLILVLTEINNRFVRVEK